MHQLWFLKLKLHNFKTKIAQLQEENESLSYSQREILEKLKN